MKRNSGLLVSGLAALVVCGYAAASSDADVLERIRPIGTVNVEKPAEPAPAAEAAATEAAPATAETGSTEATESAPAEAPQATEGEPAAAEPEVAAAPDGKKTYDSVCFVCHMAGISGAPKFADKAAWEPRIAKGMDALLQSSINGVPGTAMPPRGTCAACSDEDLKAAVEYMVSAAQ